MNFRLFFLVLFLSIAMLVTTSCIFRNNQPPVIEKESSGPSGDTLDVCITFEWLGYDDDGYVSLYQYRTDGGQWIDYSTKTSYTWCGYQEGDHTFEVRAKDDKGLTSEPILWAFTFLLFEPYLGDFVFVSGGSFTMGDTWGDGFNMEKPTHQVELPYDFFVGKYPVTFNEYNEFCVDKGAVIPSDEGWGMGSRPVINVPWWMAIEYCNWLSEKDGLPPAYVSRCEVNEGQLLDSEGKLTTDITEVLGYRLLTEAEWEYVARGGKHNSEYKWSGSDDPSLVAWYDYNSNEKTRPVGQLEPNALDIYDMSGNVLEWCTDFYSEYTVSQKTNPYVSSGTHRICRGGCWAFPEKNTRVSYRHPAIPIHFGSIAGFRIVRIAQ